jgi:hypothetical protein
MYNTKPISQFSFNSVIYVWSYAGVSTNYTYCKGFKVYIMTKSHWLLQYTYANTEITYIRVKSYIMCYTSMVQTQSIVI